MIKRLSKKATVEARGPEGYSREEIFRSMQANKLENRVTDLSKQISELFSDILDFVNENEDYRDKFVELAEENEYFLGGPRLFDLK